jgi:hypothetical protein
MLEPDDPSLLPEETVIVDGLDATELCGELFTWLG